MRAIRGSLPMGNSLGVHRYRKSREWAELEAECGFPYFSDADKGDLQSEWRKGTLKRGCFVFAEGADQSPQGTLKVKYQGRCRS